MDAYFCFHETSWDPGNGDFQLRDNYVDQQTVKPGGNTIENGGVQGKALVLLSVCTTKDGKKIWRKHTAQAELAHHGWGELHEAGGKYYLVAYDRAGQVVQRKELKEHDYQYPHWDSSRPLSTEF